MKKASCPPASWPPTSCPPASWPPGGHSWKPVGNQLGTSWERSCEPQRYALDCSGAAFFAHKKYNMLLLKRNLRLRFPTAGLYRPSFPLFCEGEPFVTTVRNWCLQLVCNCRYQFTTGLPWHCLPWPPVASRGLPWPPVAARGPGSREIHVQGRQPRHLLLREATGRNTGMARRPRSGGFLCFGCRSLVCIAQHDTSQRLKLAADRHQRILPVGRQLGPKAANPNPEIPSRESAWQRPIRVLPLRPRRLPASVHLIAQRKRADARVPWH